MSLSMSQSNLNSDFVCFICRKSHNNLKSLHSHHIFEHSLEELSFAIISLHGWNFPNDETNLFEADGSLINISGVFEQSTETKSEPIRQTIEPIQVSPATLTSDPILHNFSPKMVPYPEEISSQESSDLLNTDHVNNDSINVSNDSISIDLTNLRAPVAEKKLETCSNNVKMNTTCERAVFSSDDLSGSETDTDIEVNGSGRLFDSDYDIKIDVFEECDDLDVEDSGSRGFSPNKAANISSEKFPQSRDRPSFCENASVFPLIGPVAKLVMGDNEVTEDLKSSAEIKNLPIVSHNYSSSGKAMKEKGPSKKTVVNQCARSAIGKSLCAGSRRRQSHSTLAGELNCSPYSVDCSDENKSIHDILIPLVSVANSENEENSYIASVQELYAQNELTDIDLKPTYMIDTLSKIEFLENTSTSCPLNSSQNITTNIKVENIDHTDLSLCNFEATQIPAKTISSLCRSATTVVRTGGFFMAKVEPGPLKDSTISKVIERRFFCESCGKGYKKKSHLERHLRAHTGERPFQCSYCTKSFAVRSILKQHVRIHTGEKPYCCTVCFQRFPQKSGLMTHMMLHTGKPFKCDFCEKSFVSNHKLLQHLKSHESQNIYSCSDCKTKFFTEGALREHSKIHQEIRIPQSLP